MVFTVNDDTASLRRGTEDPFIGASPITAVGGGGLDDPAPIFARAFSVRQDATRATLRITSLGVFKAELNGQRVGADELAPGWTDYRSRLTWTEYDVTSLIRLGENRCEVLIGNGWYRGRLGRPARRDLYGADLVLLARLTLELKDGSEVVIGTDESWEWRESPVVQNDLYDGCSQDLRRGRSSMSLPTRSSLVALPRLERATAPPVRVLEELSATTEPHAEAVHVDAGRNIVGWLRIRVGPRQHERHVSVQHAEVREGDALARRPLRDADATDHYVLPAGSDELLLEPIHTFHGFRYADIVGIPSEEIREVTAVVVGSKLTETGRWASSDAQLNALHRNIRNSARGNFLSIPTDCPQRDERLGWTADAQVFAPVATYLFDVEAFLGSWLDDMQEGQTADGSIPVVIPDVYRRDSVATAGWGDACVIVPWELFNETGNSDILRRYWPMAKSWLQRVDAAVDEHGIWVDGHQYGDWLDPNAPPHRPAEAMTDPTLVATAYRVRVLHLASRWASAMGEAGEAQELVQRWKRSRSQFQQRFVTPRGFLTSESQAAYALAIAFELLNAEHLATAGARLADLVRLTDYTVGTGFLGTPVLLEALSSTGHHDVALRVLRGERSPSWLYAVAQGATSVWERWDSMLPDGSVNPGEMTSFNHFAFGAVAHWLHTELAGIRRAAPGWKSATISAPWRSDLAHVTTEHKAANGWWRVSWTREPGGRLRLDLVVPPDSTALLLGTSNHQTRIGSGHHTLHFDDQPARTEGDTLRHVMDDEPRWNSVVSAMQELRPLWTRRDVAREAKPYLSLPLPEFARAVGLSIPTSEESLLRSALAEIVKTVD